MNEFLLLLLLIVTTTGYYYSCDEEKRAYCPVWNRVCPPGPKVVPFQGPQSLRRKHCWKQTKNKTKKQHFSLNIKHRPFLETKVNRQINKTVNKTKINDKNKRQQEQRQQSTKNKTKTTTTTTNNNKQTKN